MPQADPLKRKFRGYLYWAVIACGALVPVAIAAFSPLLAWRSAVYIAAGFAGIFGLVVLLVQPFLAAGGLTGLGPRRGRKLHAGLGLGLVALVVAHVAGLWITSPPDVIDALLFRSPTLFSFWGVTAMWAVFAAATLAALRKRFPFSPKVWQRSHTCIAVVVVIGTVVHALLIDGTMGTMSKVLLCAAVVLATLRAIIRLRIWTR